MSTGNQFKKGDLVSFRVYELKPFSLKQLSNTPDYEPISKTVVRRVIKTIGRHSVVVRFNKKDVVMDAQQVRLVF